MDAYTLHLAMAALVGASFVAVSAYYMHSKTLAQLLEFAKSVERERDENSDAGASPQHVKRRGSSRRKWNGYYRRGSASLPDVTAISAPTVDCEERRNGPLHVDGIPAGLPRLRTLPEGKSSGHASSTKRAGNVIRPPSPRSPVASASASAFESVEGSDEEDDMTDSSKLDTTYQHTNGNAVRFFKPPPFNST